MKIQFWSVGKNHEPYIKVGVEDFSRRISNYFKNEWNIIPFVKNAAMLGESDLKKREAETILDALKKDDYLVALDAAGKQFDSEKLAGLIQDRANDRTKNLIFLIGGAYGLDPSVLKRADLTWSLSMLTFPHQLVRLILAEQVYRACSILRNEQYHH